MKKILLIYTGGTIGMIQKNNSLSPFDFDNLKNAIPEIKDCGSDVQHISLENPIDSSNMNIKYWRELSSCIYNHYDRYDGFVILHGSDTMAYTASIISFMFENVNKAIILTGSQLPIGIKRSDAKENLITSIEIASSGIINEVCVYFEYQLFRGNRVVKVNADNFDAFKSPNYPILAQAGVKIKYQKQYLQIGNKKKLNLFSEICNNVAVLKLFPSINKKFIKSVLNSSIPFKKFRVSILSASPHPVLVCSTGRNMAVKERCNPSQARSARTPAVNNVSLATSDLIVMVASQLRKK